eukprot:3402949-Prymnesium_polylepis.1
MRRTFTSVCCWSRDTVSAQRLLFSTGSAVHRPSHLSALGGRWEAWFIEKYGSGDGWCEAVMEK